MGIPAFSADYQKGFDAANKEDFATALREWEPLAKQGYASAQFNLGSMYDEGKGVSQNYETAVKWYTLAAEQGNARAQYNLGAIYALGKGVIQDNVYAHDRSYPNRDSRHIPFPISTMIVVGRDVD